MKFLYLCTLRLIQRAERETAPQKCVCRPFPFCRKPCALMFLSSFICSMAGLLTVVNEANNSAFESRPNSHTGLSHISTNVPHGQSPLVATIADRLPVTSVSDPVIKKLDVLFDCDVGNWEFVTASGAHTVFRYTGLSLKENLKVLKIRTQPANVKLELIVGFADLLKKIQEPEHLNGSGRRGIFSSREGGGSPRLYGLISPMYLPVHRIVRVPTHIVELFLSRARQEQHQDRYEKAFQELKVAPPVKAEHSEDTAQRVFIKSRGVAFTKREPTRAKDSILDDDAEYQLCILEDDLLTPPSRISDNIEYPLYPTRYKGLRQRLFHKLTGTAFGRRSSRLADGLEGQRETRDSHPVFAEFQKTLYYTVELKPKCGLIETPYSCAHEQPQSPSPLKDAISDAPPQHTFPVPDSRSPGKLLDESTEVDLGFDMPRRHTATVATLSTNRVDQKVVDSHDGDKRYTRTETQCECTEATARPHNAVQSRFQMQQYVKLADHRISRRSSYDPVAFFGSRHSAEFRRQLEHLVEAPQNNFKVFLDGTRLFAFGRGLRAKQHTIGRDAAPSQDAEVTQQELQRKGLSATARDELVLTLLAKIWEREKEIFGSLLVLQAFAAGQQRISFVLLSELQRVTGSAYPNLRNLQLLENVNLYAEACAAGLELIEYFDNAKNHSRYRSKRDLSSAAFGIRGIHMWLKPPKNWCMEASPGTSDAQCTHFRRIADVSMAEQMQSAHKREASRIVDALKIVKDKAYVESGHPDEAVCRLVFDGFSWIRRYLLGRTFQDVSVMTNIFIQRDGVFRNTQSVSKSASAFFRRFIRLPLELHNVEPDLLAEVESTDRTSEIPEKLLTATAAVYYRVSLIDLDFKSDGKIQRWFKDWERINQIYCSSITPPSAC